MINLEQITEKSLRNEALNKEECDFLTTCTLEELTQSAQHITAQYHNEQFDLCSIINAKSGKCSEDCKWCAQSGHFKANIDTYSLVSTQECLRQATYNAGQGIHRFSLVTSGRKLSGKDFERVCETYATLKEQTNIYLCASLGLLNQNELKTLAEKGVKRYHCNLETSASFFPSLCSTHSQEEKIETIKAAQAVGMEICSGGIIGMGESVKDRCELALTLRKLGIKSIPINILVPIPGTPLAQQPALAQEEILQCIALFRIINPEAKLRFSGGRTRINQESQKAALAMGVNAAIVGDLLTTVGSCVEEDKELFKEAGFSI